jgi:hypothetical protein
MIQGKQSQQTEHDEFDEEEKTYDWMELAWKV